MIDRITYRVGNDIPVEVVKTLYEASTLGQRRPIDDPGALAAMMEHANLVVSAWDDDELVGISRTLTDFVYVGYLYYPRIGFTHHPQAWILAATDPFPAREQR